MNSTAPSQSCHPRWWAHLLFALGVLPQFQARDRSNLLELYLPFHPHLRSGMAEGYCDDPSEEEHRGPHHATTLDQREMLRMGKGQELRRNYHKLSAVAFMVILQGSWEVMLVACREGLTNGGLAGLFWSSVWTFAGMTPVVLSLAEMVSMAPTSGGQYHWVSEFAPQEWQRLLSYYTGWVSAMSWQAGAASGPWLVGTLLTSVFEDPHVRRDGGEGFREVIFIIMTVFAVYLCGCHGGSGMAVLQNLLLFLHILGVLIVSMPRYVRSRSSFAKIADHFAVCRPLDCCCAGD